MPTAVTPALLPAHGVGAVESLPLPLPALVTGAAAALVVSFLALGVLWRQPRLDRDAGVPLPGPLARALDSRWLRGGAITLALLLTGWTVLALAAGRDDANNPAPYVVYVWLWVGLAVLSMLFGPIWRVLNPVRWLHLGINRVARLDPDERMVRWSPGMWPGAVGLFAFAWLELIAPDRTTLPVLRVAVLVFVTADLVGAFLLGRRWFSGGDPFEVWSRLLGSLSPLGRRRDRTWVLRTPLHGVNALRLRRGMTAAVAVMLGSTAYDALSGQPRWYGLVQSAAVPATVLETLGLLGMCVVVAGALAVAAAVSARLAGLPFRGMTVQFAPSLVPIAAGYVIAHYWALLVYAGQLTLVRLTDPLGIGANWLGTAGLTPDTRLIAPTLTATIQVVAIVTGHVLGVVLAHERAVTLFDRRVAVLGQVPMLVLMVGYTCGGLLLLYSS